MGVKGLNRIFDEFKNIKSIENIKINEMKNSTVAIDANNWLYQFLCAGRKSSDGEILNSKGVKITIIIGLYRRIMFMLKKNIKPVFVFDGKPPIFKNVTLKNRKKNKCIAQEKIDNNEYNNIEEKKKLIQRASSVTKNDIILCKKLIKILGLPIIDAPGEADAELAYLQRKKLVDYIISEDNDIIVFGGNNVIKGFKASKAMYNLTNLDDFYKKTGLTQEDLAKIAILLGCDYFQGVKGIGIKRISKMIENKKIEFELAQSINPDVNEILEHFLKPKVSGIQSLDFQKIDIEKLNEYLKVYLEFNTLQIQNSIGDLIC